MHIFPDSCFGWEAARTSNWKCVLAALRYTVSEVIIMNVYRMQTDPAAQLAY